MKIKQGIPHNERQKAIEWAFEYFKDVVDKRYFYAIVAQETNWDLSARLVDDNDKVMGLYLLGDEQISSLVMDKKIDKYWPQKGVEGVLLAIDPSIRKQGWGNKLKNYPSTLGFDYIWGQQLKTLNNLQDWLKRRVLIAQTNEVYITLEEFRK